MNAASLLGSGLGDFDFDLDAEVTEPTKEPLFGLFNVAVGKVRATEVRRSEISRTRSPIEPGPQFGVLAELRVQLENGLRAP